MKSKTILLGLVVVLSAGTARANLVPERYLKPCIPDFSQYTGVIYDSDGMRLGGWTESFCAPTAVANSLYWMSQYYNLPKLAQKQDGSGQWVDYLSDVQMIEELALAMGFTEIDGEWSNQTDGGVDRDHLLSGKWDYMHSRVPILVQKWMQRPTLDWIQAELYKCEDVEVTIGYYDWVLDSSGNRTDIVKPKGGHMMTFVGWNATQLAFHDPAWNLGASEWKDYPGTGFDHDAYTDYYQFATFTLSGLPYTRLMNYPGADVVLIELAVSESVPEPLTVLGLLLGAPFAVRYVRRRLAVRQLVEEARAA